MNEPRELCDSKNLASDKNCIRHAGHKGNCWAKWEREVGFPSAIVRRTWTLGVGFLAPGYQQRRILSQLGN